MKIYALIIAGKAILAISFIALTGANKTWTPTKQLTLHNPVRGHHSQQTAVYVVLHKYTQDLYGTHTHTSSVPNTPLKKDTLNKMMDTYTVEIIVPFLFKLITARFRSEKGVRFVSVLCHVKYIYGRGKFILL